jgi:hypothetical protein
MKTTTVTTTFACNGCGAEATESDAGEWVQLDRAVGAGDPINWLRDVAFQRPLPSHACSWPCVKAIVDAHLNPPSRPERKPRPESWPDPNHNT